MALQWPTCRPHDARAPAAVPEPRIITATSGPHSFARPRGPSGRRASRLSRCATWGGVLVCPGPRSTGTSPTSRGSSPRSRAKDFRRSRARCAAPGMRQAAAWKDCGRWARRTSVSRERSRLTTASCSVSIARSAKATPRWPPTPQRRSTCCSTRSRHWSATARSLLPLIVPRWRDTSGRPCTVSPCCRLTGSWDRIRRQPTR